MTPAALRAQSLPFRSEEAGLSPASASGSTQLISMEPKPSGAHVRARGGFLVLWALVIVMGALAVLLVTGRITA